MSQDDLLQNFYDDLERNRSLDIDLLIKYANSPRVRSSDEIKAVREQFVELRQSIPLLQAANRCAICYENGLVHLHHIIPINCGGDNHPLNLVPLCEKCHSQVHPWLQSQIEKMRKEMYGILIDYASDYKQLQKEVESKQYGYKVKRLRDETITKIIGLIDY